MKQDEKPLAGKVAVVAGASRSSGRATAIELGAAGAIVYCTARSVRGSTTGRPETIEETAQMVEAHGGKAFPVRVDHTEPAQVQAFFERVSGEQEGRLDILVNDIWGGEGITEWKPFWEQNSQAGLAMVANAVNSHIVTNHFAAPLMIARGRGIIFEVTDGETYDYRGSLFYDLAKISVIRLAYAMHRDFQEQKMPITAVAITPGWLRSENMLDHFGVTAANWRDVIATNPAFAYSETPRYLGRAIAALAADPEIEAKAGDRTRALSSWGTAKVYGFRDIDGRQPLWGERSEGLPE